jgi:hypothetical protein
MTKNEPKPNAVKRAVKTVAKHANVNKAARTLDRILAEELGPDTGRKADSSMVAPTPTGGLSCIIRAAELVGFAGAVTMTAAAALVGRCRR